MGSERAIFEAVPRTFAVVGIVISEMWIHSHAEKPQSNGRHLSIISISLGWANNHAYETFGVTEVKSAVLQKYQGNRSESGSEALVL